MNLSSVLRLLRNGILNVLEISEKRAKPPPNYIALVTTIIVMLQLTSFVTMDYPGLKPWPETMKPFEFVASLTNVRGYDAFMSESIFFALTWWIAFVWTSVLASILVWGVYCFSQNDFPFLWPLVVLRTMGNLSAGVLFIPLLQMLLSFNGCSTTCSPTMTFIQIVVSTFAAVFLSSLSLLFVGVLYEANQWSREIKAQAHGRLNIIILIIQIVLVISFSAIGVGSVFLRCLILFLCGSIWLFATVYYMPYYSHTMNRLLAGGAVLYLSGVTSLIINYYFVIQFNAAILFYLLAPLAFFVGVGLADARANNIACSPAERMNSTYEVELKARYMLHQFLFGHPIFIQLTSGNNARKEARDMEEGSLMSAAAQTSQVSKNMAATKGTTSKSLNDNSAPRSLSDKELAELLDIYRSAATRRYSESSILHLFCSRFFGNVLGNRHMQMSHLLQADRCSPALDVAFTIFQSRRSLENQMAQSKGTSSISALSRVSFDKHAADARRSVMRAAARQFAFWTELNEPTPDLSRLHYLSRETHEAVRAAEKDFAEVFLLSPQALAQLRLYAAFNLHVTSNTEKASVLLAEAERIEDARTKEHRSEAGSHLDVLSETSLDVWSDSTAIVTISNNVRDLGVILTLNTAACKLFGYSRIQLERRSAFMLIPAPLDRLHEDSLLQYSQSGESALGVVDYSRVILILTKEGTIKPVLSTFKDAPIDEVASYIWALRELRTDTNYIIADSDGVITAVDATTATMWDVDVSLLDSRSLHITFFIPDWAKLQPEMLSQAGAVIDVLKHKVARANGDLSQQDDDHQEEAMMNTKVERLGHGDSDDSDSPNDSSGAPAEQWGIGGHGLANSAGIDLSHLTICCRVQMLHSSNAMVIHWKRMSPSDVATLAVAKLAAERPASKPRRPSSAASDVEGVFAAAAAKASVTRKSRFTPRGSGVVFADIELDAADSLFDFGVADSDPVRTNPAATSSQPLPLSPRILPASYRASAVVSTPKPTMPKLSKIVTEVVVVNASSQIPAGGSRSVAICDAPVSSVQEYNVDEYTDINNGHSDASQGVSLTPTPRQQGGEVVHHPRSGLSPLETIRIPPALAVKAGSVFMKGLAISKLRAAMKKGGNVNNEGTIQDGGLDVPSVHSTKGKVGRSMIRLRKILSNDHPPMQNILVWLRISGMMLTILTICLAAVVVVITDANFTLINHNMQYVSLASERMHAKASAFLSLQELIFSGRNWTSLSKNEDDAHRAHIIGNTTFFVERHLAMRALTLDDDSWTWTSQYVTLLNPDMPTKGTYSPIDVLNQHETGLIMASLLNFLASPFQMPASAYNLYTDGSSKGEPHLAAIFVDFMRGGNGHEVLSAAVQYGFNDVLLKVNDIAETQLNVFLGMILTTGFVAFLIFLPIIVKLDGVGDHIMLQFVKIPAPVRAVLYQTAEKRMHLLRRDYADEDGDGSDYESGGDRENPDDGDGVMEGTGAVAEEDDNDGTCKLSDALKNIGTTSENNSVTSGTSSVRAISQGDMNMAAAMNIFTANKKVLYRKNATILVKLMIRFISPLIVIVVLFTTVYMSFEIQASKVRRMAALVVSSGIRTSCARQATVGMRNLAMLTTDSHYSNSKFFYSMGGFNCVRSQNRLLGSGTIDTTIASAPYVSFTGTPENGLPSYLSEYATNLLHGAMYGNACEFLAQRGGDPNFDIPRCERFGGGVLKLGLAALTEMWWKKGYMFCDKRLRVSFITTELYDGNGWLTNSEDFDYASVKCDATKGCTPGKVLMPLRSGIIKPSVISNRSWEGDVTPDAFPGDGFSILPQNNRTGRYSVAEQLNSDTLHFMQEADALYLTRGLKIISMLYFEEATALNDAFMNFIHFFVPFFVLLFTLIMILWFLPEAVLENRVMQTKRAMLLYLPIIVIAKIKSIKRLVENIIAMDTADNLAGTVDSNATAGKRSKVMPR